MEKEIQIKLHGAVRTMPVDSLPKSNFTPNGIDLDDIGGWVDVIEQLFGRGATEQLALLWLNFSKVDKPASPASVENRAIALQSAVSIRQANFSPMVVPDKPLLELAEDIYQFLIKS